MSVLKGTHCGTVHIYPDGEPDSAICNKHGCLCIMRQLDEPEAGNALRAAFYGHDHGFSRLPIDEQLIRTKAHSEGLQRMADALNTPEAP